ncbi:MAG TPA: GNAT family N-acetyltransferase [Myxococcaceae bacterium]|jgi:GNAT superfamily N-acetyltransferase
MHPGYRVRRAVPEELGVHPEHGWRGLGTALVEAVCGWAREQEAGFPMERRLLMRRAL